MLIDRRLFIKYMVVAGVMTPRMLCASPDLRSAFAKPPQGVGPGIYWYWLGGNVTREGITADLEAMRDVGIWNPMLFTIGKSGPDTPIQPPADVLTPHWWDLLEHAAAEAARLGMILSVNSCDGWATASGPWITPELSMQYVVWSEQTIEGGKHFDAVLPQPPAKRDYYREIATIALPYPREWEETSFNRRPRITTNLPLQVPDVTVLSDPDNRGEVVDTRQSGWIEYAFDAPFTLRCVRVHTPSPPGYAPGVYRAANSLEVQASDDGMTFRRIGALEYPRHGWQTDLTTLTHAVPQTTARYFRLVHTQIPPQPYQEEYDFGQDTRLRFFSIVLSSEPRIHHLQGKTGEQWALSRRTSAADVPDSACIPLQSIVDLTSKVDAAGKLAWDVPRGRWRVLRLGYTTTGAQNSAAGGAQGLECDRFSAAAARLQFDSWFGQALARVGPTLVGKVLHVLHVDSWEAGSQNWSPGFAAGFHSLRGYDLLPYIATLTGVPLVSADVSERVLLDVRRTINDLMQSGFFATLTRLAHQQGCLVSAEPPNPTFTADGLEHFGWVDWPMGEFWLKTPRNDKPTDIKDAVCGARLYGKPIAAAEAFTQSLMSWDEHPFTFKAPGDRVYCEGVNRFMLHVYAQQPWLDRAPGMTLNGIGTFFSRTQTWWRPGKAWFDYLRRCQALLQEGVAVADVCYFTGENLPARALLPRQLSVPLPEGYSYDCINRDGLLHLTEVRDGWLVCKGGGRYRVLVLPDDELMTPEIATRLRELVRAGATVVGPRRPMRSPSLTNAAAADATVGEVAEELWGPGGRVSRSLDLGLPPDVEVNAPSIRWTHRRGPDWDVFFLSNQADSARSVTATFRVAGRRPQLWHADTGEIERLALWREEDGRTVVPLNFAPVGSVFVVFARPTGAQPYYTAIEGDGGVSLREGEAIVSEPGNWILRDNRGGERRLSVRSLPRPIDLDGPWQVGFAGGPALTFPALVSWTERPEEAVKYYSGTAHYAKALTLPETRGEVWLELGAVHDLVEVWLNSQQLGVLWKPPFRINVTRAVRAGRNQLELAVTNTWHNRLVGDSGKEVRQTFVFPMLRLGKPWLPATGLLPAGLLGPVRLRYTTVVRLD